MAYLSDDLKPVPQIHIYHQAEGTLRDCLSSGDRGLGIISLLFCGSKSLQYWELDLRQVT